MIKKILLKKPTLPLLALLLLIPIFAEAAIGTGIFDFFNAKLAGISEMVGPFAAFFVFIVAGLLIAGAALHVSVWLLTIAADPAKMVIAESQMVQVGWQFTSSLANTAIIVFLIVIGIATILNQDSYSAKKALPKLIIVALLVNFSLVFVGAVVDISNIVLNTFFEVDMAGRLTETIFESWDSNLTSILLYLGGLMTSFIIPFVSAIAQYAFVVAITTSFLPTVIGAIMQIFTNFMVSGILFVYALLFFARIFIIQILAVLSPLAFVAWALPSTKKLWDRWLNALVGWSMLGVILFFFLLLSTIATEPLRPDPGFSSAFISRANISTVFIYYIILVIFLSISAYISKKFMPEGADAVIDGAKKAATRFQSNPITQNVMKRMKGSLASGSTAETISEKEQRVQENQNRLELSKQTFKDASGGSKISTGFGAVRDWGRAQTSKASREFSKASRTASVYTGESPEQRLEEVKNKDKDMWLKGKTDEELKTFLGSEKVPDYRKDQIRETLISKGALSKKDMMKELEKDIPTERKEQLIKSLLGRGAKYEGELKEEADKILSAENLPNSKRRKDDLIKELVDKGADIENTTLEDQVIEKWDELSKETKKTITNKFPDIHIQLAERAGKSMEEGIGDMVEKINDMDDVKSLQFYGNEVSELSSEIDKIKKEAADRLGKELKDLDPENDLNDEKKSKIEELTEKLDKKTKISTTIAQTVSKDPAKLKSLNGAGYSQKANFINSIGRATDPESGREFKKFLSNPENIERWPTHMVNEMILENQIEDLNMRLKNETEELEKMKNKKTKLFNDSMNPSTSKEESISKLEESKTLTEEAKKKEKEIEKMKKEIEKLESEKEKSENNNQK